jgi:hypothetical protein
MPPRDLGRLAAIVVVEAVGAIDAPDLDRDAITELRAGGHDWHPTRATTRTGNQPAHQRAATAEELEAGRRCAAGRPHLAALGLALLKRQRPGLDPVAGTGTANI